MKMSMWKPVLCGALLSGVFGATVVSAQQANEL